MEGKVGLGLPHNAGTYFSGNGICPPAGFLLKAVRGRLRVNQYIMESKKFLLREAIWRTQKKNPCVFKQPGRELNQT